MNFPQKQNRGIICNHIAEIKMNTLCNNEAMFKAVHFENLSKKDIPPLPPIQMETVLDNIVIWLSEGKDIARILEKAYSKTIGEGQEAINFLIKQCKVETESKIRKCNKEYAREVVARNDIFVLFKESKRHFSEVQRYLKELKETEYLAHFLETYEGDLTDLKIKVRDILRELELGTEDNCDSGCSSGSNSGSNSCEESDTGSNDSCESDSSDSENHRVMNRMDQHDRDFKKWYNIYLTFKTETHKYDLIKRAYRK